MDHTRGHSAFVRLKTSALTNITIAHRTKSVRTQLAAFRATASSDTCATKSMYYCRSKDAQCFIYWTFAFQTDFRFIGRHYDNSASLISYTSRLD